ncbi:MAG: hypothetical protein GXP29_03380 [Planctomycetes bacterium]|nr:hypothetical protein [Planctomycetota bacterium]
MGSETATLTVLSADLTNLGIYSCIVSDGCISTESGSASLSLFAPGAIVQQPTPLATTCTGNIVLLSVGASGDGLIYQWLQDGLSLQEQPGKYENVDTATLRIVNANVADLAEYTCVVNDNCGGEETSTSAFLQFGDISYVVQPSPACAVQGDNVSYTASAEAGGFSIFVQWYKDGIPLSEGGDFSGVFTDTLVVQNASVGDEGAYSQRALSLGPNCVLFSDEVSLQLNSCFCVLPGDMDADGDLDLVDIQRFAECFEANVASITNCACANVDDTDDSVNLADWDAYAPILTGP